MPRQKSRAILEFAAMAGTALTIVPARADERADAEHQLNAQVPGKCVVIGQPTAIGQGATVSIESSEAGGSVVTANVAFGSLADQSNAQLTVDSYGVANPGAGNPSAILSFNAACNFASSYIGLSSVNGALVNGTPGNFPGFATGIAYAVALEWPTPSAAIPTFVGAGAPSSSVSNPVALPTSGSVRMVLRPFATITNGALDASPTRPLLAGTYSETLRIRLGQNP